MRSLAFLLIGISSVTQDAHPPKPSAVAPAIPKTWDDEAIATLELPLADPVGSPKQVSAEYYYRIPVPPIYKGYPVYAPGHEPDGYMDWLRRQEPVIVWDEAGHAPPLKTDADWIKAGETVFDAPTDFDRFVTLAETRDPAWYRRIGTPVAKDGTVPFLSYVVRKKGTVEVGQISCAMCHTRVMPDGSTVKGAQTNFPTVRAVASSIRSGAAQSNDTSQLQTRLRLEYRAEWSVPWLSPDPAAQVGQMSLEELDRGTGGSAGRCRCSSENERFLSCSGARPDWRQGSKVSRPHRPSTAPLDRRSYALRRDESREI